MNGSNLFLIQANTKKTATQNLHGEEKYFTKN